MEARYKLRRVHIATGLPGGADAWLLTVGEQVFILSDDEAEALVADVWEHLDKQTNDDESRRNR